MTSNRAFYIFYNLVIKIRNCCNIEVQNFYLYFCKSHCALNNICKEEVLSFSTFLLFRSTLHGLYETKMQNYPTKNSIAYSEQFRNSYTSFPLRLNAIKYAVE